MSAAYAFDPSANNARQIAQQLQKASGSGNQWKACCPAHEDTNPSLSITQTGGKVLFKCHAGCSQEHVLSALKGLGLYRTNNDSDRFPKSDAANTTYYVYRDEQGNPLHRTIRKRDKTFWQEQYKDGSWISGLTHQRLVPYHLDEISSKKMERVYVAEGEKDVDRLRSLGFLSTCNPLGAGKWRNQYSEMIAGRNVVLFYDNDTAASKFAGQDHAEKVALSLLQSGCTVRIVNLPDGINDVSDFLDLYSKTDLDRLISDAASLSEEGVVAWRRKFDPVVTVPVKTGPEICTADELYAGTFAAPEAIIDKLIYPGITLLQGPPKLGKSYLVLQACLSLIEGRPLMNYFSGTRKHNILYVDLEGTKLRANQRLRQLGDQSSQAKNLCFMFRPLAPWPDNLKQIEEEIKRRNITLIVLDTLLALMKGPKKQSGNIVGNDYDVIEQIRSICVPHNCSAIVVSHSKKNTDGMSATDAGIGSTGISAAVDSLLTLRRVKGGAVVLDALPRDAEESSHEIRLNPGKDHGWLLVGAGADAGNSPQRRAITDMFRTSERPLRPKDVSDFLGTNASTTRTLIQKLTFDGLLSSNSDGTYSLRAFEC